ncbi:hypothetical protein D9M72_115550 [compost metagenome]
MVLAADAGLLVAPECRMRGVGMVAVGPHAPRLDAAAHAECARAVTCPDTGTQPVERVVGNGQRLFLILEGGHRYHRPEDLFLEDAHLVVAGEYGRLDVVAARQVAVQHVALAAGEALRAFLAAQVDVRQDLLQLFGGRLRADHGAGVERMALADRGHALECALHEAVVDRFLDQRARRAGADLALVQREHGKAFQRLVEEGVVGGQHVLEEDVGRLAAQLQRHRDQVLRRVLHDQPAGGGLAGERHLADARARCQRLAGFQPEAVDHIDHARRQQVADDLHQHQDRCGRLLGRLEHHAVAGGQGRRQLPGGHQQREVPRDDLADHAQRLMEMVGNGVGVDLGDAAFLRTDAAGKVAEVVDRQRQVGGGGFAHRLAVVDALGHGQQLQVGLDAVGDAAQDIGALGGGGVGPRGLGGVGGVQRGVDILLAGARHARERLAGDRRDRLEVLAAGGRHPLAADVVLVLLLVGVADAQLGDFRHVHVSLRSVISVVSSRHSGRAHSRQIARAVPGRESNERTGKNGGRVRVARVGYVTRRHGCASA